MGYDLKAREKGTLEEPIERPQEEGEGRVSEKVVAL